MTAEVANRLGKPVQTVLRGLGLSCDNLISADVVTADVPPLDKVTQARTSRSHAR
jgi:hypothetical protein